MPPGNLGSQEGQCLNCAVASEKRLKVTKSFIIRLDRFDREFQRDVNVASCEKEDGMCLTWGKGAFKYFSGGNYGPKYHHHILEAL